MDRIEKIQRLLITCIDDSVRNNVERELERYIDELEPWQEQDVKLLEELESRVAENQNKTLWALITDDKWVIGINESPDAFTRVIENASEDEDISCTLVKLHIDSESCYLVNNIDDVDGYTFYRRIKDLIIE
jgi:hypothetical protein